MQCADVAIGNLEVTLGGAPYKGYPAFSSPDALAVACRNAGFDILVTANNHSADRGTKGLVRTIRVLDSLGIQAYRHMDQQRGKRQPVTPDDKP
ncbi:MAG: CapA family protein [Marinilabiliales bacterium]|nr:CapA family protein [Marinilabiliales bacterium]